MQERVMRMKRWNGILIFSLVFVFLAACQKDKDLVIENASVELGSLQDPDDRNLHFRVEIHEYYTDPALEYKVRFIIQNAYIRDLIATEKIEVPDTYNTEHLQKDGSSGLVTGSSVVLKKDFNIDKIRKNLKKNEAVIVEIYDENRIIARSEVTNFRENIMPKATINPNAKIKMLELKEKDQKEIFGKAVSHSEKSNYTIFVNPNYIFSLDEESYYLWLSVNEGMIMNTKDHYAIYSLSSSSLNEIKEFLK